ncbi:hypothetical protein OpiT1DRAFT_03858 [Opitutaceae bacterium TAV1]|nr:hypothetical protein OpiT1DRAFT_03858 [Opitutaceae bacterium TAV1]
MNPTNKISHTPTEAEVDAAYDRASALDAKASKLLRSIYEMENAEAEEIRRTGCEESNKVTEARKAYRAASRECREAFAHAQHLRDLMQAAKEAKMSPLLAAAPELLHFAEFARREVASVLAMDPNDDRIPRILSGLRDEAAKTIAKAEGRE